MSNTIKSGNSKLGGVFKQTEFTLAAIIILLFIIASVFTNNFFSLYNITNLTKQCAIVGVLAVAQTMIIITGGIDISCGAIAGLSCMVMALLQRDTGTNFWITLLIAVAVGIFCGFINGVIIYDLKVPPYDSHVGCTDHSQRSSKDHK